MMSKVILRWALILSFISFAGCSMERIPATARLSQPTPHINLDPCLWQSLPNETHELLPHVKQLDFDIAGPVKDVFDQIEWKINWKTGEPRGQESRKPIDSVTLTTGELGAIYEIEYKPLTTKRELLGVWCGWKIGSDAPPTNTLLQNEFGIVEVEPDGGVVYRIHWREHLPSQGTAIILCGLGGLQYAPQLLGEELLKQGWVVCYVYTVLDTPDIGMNIDFDGTAQGLIDLFNDKYCQVISATEAVKASSSMHEPALGSLPIVLIGFSAGALNTPAVYHAMQNEIDCVVLIAGGANMFYIVQEGAVTNWDFKTDGTFLKYAELQKLEANYLNTPSRDPYHLAQILPHDKTLLLHAKWDAIVPAENGDLLWVRAGKPERWVYPSGHLGLFATFDQHAENIVEWINLNSN